MAEQKVWFITGVSRGFGRIWAQAALARGDRVVATARRREDLQDLAQAYGELVLTLALDVTDHEAVLATVRRGAAHFGRLDVIVSSAGYGYMGAVEELDVDQVRANFETNVLGTLAVIQAALPVLKAQGSGHIITVSSVGGVLSFPTGGAYTASKFAIEALSEALAGEVASFGIRVTILEPGSYATGFGASTRMAAQIAEYNPVRQAVRAGFRPEQVGDPHATAEVLLTLVDAEQPPLRLVLGATTIPMFEQAYQQRLALWKAWEPLAVQAQG